MAKKPQAAQSKTAPEENGPTECCVIMPFSDQLGYEPGHFNLVYEDIIKPAIEAADMVPTIGTDRKGTDLIHLEILKTVIYSEIAVVDISSMNPNVFYELGLRQAFDKPTVILKDERTDAPFDISGLRYTAYDSKLGYRDVNGAVIALRDAILETYENKNDPSRVNSLIRLLQISQPAEIGSTNLTEEEKGIERILVKIASLEKSVTSIAKQQNNTINIRRKGSDHQSNWEHLTRLLNGTSTECEEGLTPESDLSLADKLKYYSTT